MIRKDFISIKDLRSEDIDAIFGLAAKLKKNRYQNTLRGKSVVLLFQKPSCRTRVSFEVGINQLGGNAIYLGPDEIQLGVREAVKDVGRTLSRYCDAIVARVFDHQDIVELARYATCPVVNGLSDLLHPCQALADIFTIYEKKGDLKKVHLAYVGDGNNVLHSLLYAAGKTGMRLSAATPPGYEPRAEIVEEAATGGGGGKITITTRPEEAVSGADIIYTDVWTSMGQEGEKEKREEDFQGFQVNASLLSLAKSNVYVMHCLPAHRGEEITDEVLDGPHSIVFDQAENRLHVQKAILTRLVKRGQRPFFPVNF